ncbi:hypothetical protein BAUCODRAFT_45711, partial [Baudoinia panamericana UAMH 10762]
TVIIAVDGACRNNGRPNAESGVGIFFHEDNYQWNEVVKLETDNHTSQRAELYAGLYALRAARSLRRLNTSRTGKHRRPGPMRSLRRVVIKADSEYLVKGMTVWIEKWRANGFINARGLPVVNEDLFRELDDLVQQLNDRSVEVQFWQVPRAQNEPADCLANAALD